MSVSLSGLCRKTFPAFVCSARQLRAHLHELRLWLYGTLFVVNLATYVSYRRRLLFQYAQTPNSFGDANAVVFSMPCRREYMHVYITLQDCEWYPSNLSLLLMVPSCMFACDTWSHHRRTRHTCPLEEDVRQSWRQCREWSVICKQADVSVQTKIGRGLVGQSFCQSSVKVLGPIHLYMVN